MKIILPIEISDFLKEDLQEQYITITRALERIEYIRNQEKHYNEKAKENRTSTVEQRVRASLAKFWQEQREKALIELEKEYQNWIAARSSKE